MPEDGSSTEGKGGVAGAKKVEHEYPAPARLLRWFVIRFFKMVEAIIRLFGAIYYGIKTIAVLLFRYFWPYPVFFRRRR